MSSVTLIGMPGSGKSYVGRKLAEALGYKLVDLDKIMEENFKAPLQKILDDLGVKSFLEQQAVDAVKNARSQEGLVVSPGGSIVYSDPAMRHLKGMSKVVYLLVSLETIKDRIGDAPRGIVGSMKKSIEELYRERTPLYEKWADLIIDGEGNAVGIVEGIKEGLEINR